MKAIILAAGRGSRMKQMTDDRPKCLVELKGKPLLQWQIGALIEGGISYDDIAVVTGYKHEMLSSFTKHQFHNERWETTNMVSSLACASEWLENHTCIVSYSDIFYSSSAIKNLIACDGDIAITYDVNWLSLWMNRFGDPLLDAETFKFNDKHELIEIGQKPKDLSEIQGQYMGLLKFSPNGWEQIQTIRNSLNLQERNHLQMTKALQKILQSKSSIKAIPYTEEWGEIDNQDDLMLYKIT